MKHTLQRICMSVCVVILVTGMLGCERDNNTPSGPNLIQDAWLFAGTITDVGQETQDYGTVMLFSWPGSSGEWWEVFSF